MRRRMLTAAMIATAVACGDSPTDLPKEGPDLIVSLPEIPSQVPFGSDVGIRVEVLNRGTHTAPATQVLFLRSDDQTITPDDELVDSEFTDTIPPSDRTVVRGAAQPPPDDFGPLYFGVCVQPVHGEMDPNNNCSSAVTVEIYIRAPRGMCVGQTHESLTSRIRSSGGQKRYQIYRRRDDAGAYSLHRELPSVGDVIDYLDGDGVEPNTVYHYYANACNGDVCSEESDEWAGLTEAAGPVDIPGIPTVRGEKVVISFGGDRARVHWDPVPDATHYRIFQDSRDQPDGERCAPATSYYDSNPNTGLFGSYLTTSYRVAACNKAGCSDDSERVTIRYLAGLAAAQARRDRPDATAAAQFRSFPAPPPRSR
ncbi:MAG: hypothetical protein OXK77_11435 [Gemmatimonadota bacterium]|nr:hypothetical protein [Gemmatimonadota bacterium]MDE2865851.1 hypothetical protein [Gemmatimonadota bacterium]